MKPACFWEHCLPCNPQVCSCCFPRLYIPQHQIMGKDSLCSQMWLPGHFLPALAKSNTQSSQLCSYLLIFYSILQFRKDGNSWLTVFFSYPLFWYYQWSFNTHLSKSQTFWLLSFLSSPKWSFPPQHHSHPLPDLVITRNHIISKTFNSNITLLNYNQSFSAHFVKESFFTTLLPYADQSTSPHFLIIYWLLFSLLSSFLVPPLPSPWHIITHQVLSTLSPNYIHLFFICHYISSFWLTIWTR